METIRNDESKEKSGHLWFDRAADRERVQLELAVAAGQRRHHARGGQLLDPADVSRQDEVPGGPHHMGAQDGARVEQLVHAGIRGPAHAHAQGPLAGGVVL